MGDYYDDMNCARGCDGGPMLPSSGELRARQREKEAAELLTRRHKLCADLYRAGMLREADDVERLTQQLHELDKEFAVPTFKPPKGVPVVGDLIYLPTRCSISHGEDDVRGGVGVIMSVTPRISAGEPTPFVTTHEQPGRRHNWEYLSREQAEMMELYGDQWARPDPDLGGSYGDAL